MMVLCKKETRCNGYLLFFTFLTVLTGFNFLPVAFEVILLNKDPTGWSLISLIIARFCRNLTFWLFPIQILKTSLTIPVIFSQKNKQQQKAQKQKVNCLLGIIITVIIVYEIYTEGQVIWDAGEIPFDINLAICIIFQALATLLAVLFLRK